MSQDNRILSKTILTVPHEAAIKRKATRWLLYIFCSVAAPFVLLCAVGDHLGKRALQRQLSVVRKSSGPLNMIDADVRPRVKDDENAARYYEAAFDLIRKPTDRERSALPKVLGSVKLPDLGVKLPEEVSKAAAKYLRKNADALVLLRKGANFPRCRFRIDWDGRRTLLRHLAKMQDAARLLALDSLFAASQGDFERAVRSCRGALRMCHALNKEPTVISQLVRMAVCRVTLECALQRILASGAIDLGLLDAIEMDVVRADNDFELGTAWAGERAMLIELINEVRSGKFGVKEYSGMPEYFRRGCWRFNAVTFWLLDASGLLEFDAARALGLMNELLEYQRLPMRERRRFLKEWDERVKKLRGKHRILTTTLLPDAADTLDREMEHHALLRIARAALSFEKYRQENGRFPSSVSDALPHGIGPPIDPFTGDPLLVVRTKDGVIIYSVGADEQDDNGLLERAPKTWRCEDVGFRLLNPDMRGRPHASKRQ